MTGPAKATLVFLLVSASHPQLALAQNDTWHVCRAYEKRVTCVVDGDTLWYRGAKIRLIGIDAPETDGRCAAERELASAATDMLVSILNSGVQRIAFDGEDPYGRALAHIWARAGQIGPAMIASGLAVPYTRVRSRPWCRP